jgi:SAM-dependent methyltransferase
MSAPPLPLNAWLRWDVVGPILEGLAGVSSVLEIGAGVGAFAARLAARYDYLGLEPDAASCAAAKQRLAAVGRGRMLCADTSALEPGATFDLVCAFEVLEHLKDDAGALRDWRERVRPDGWVLLSVPARPQRRTRHDIMVGHVRRYDRRGLAAVLAETGFADARVLSYGFPAGYALELARDVLARLAPAKQSADERTAESGRRFQPSDRLGPLTRGVSSPLRFVQRPFLDTDLGTGLVAVARRAG